MRRLALLSLLVLVIFNGQSQSKLLPRSTGEFIDHGFFSISYDESKEQALWVAYLLEKQEILGSAERSNKFKKDHKVSTKSAEDSDYLRSGYDRGHLIPAADLRYSQKGMDISFLMSNISPQKASFNRGVWKSLESQVRDWVTKEGELFVVTGPVFIDFVEYIGKNRVKVPSHFYKIVVDLNEPEIKSIAFLLPNEKCEEFDSYQVSIDEIEEITGIDFFYQLEDSLERKIESVLYDWLFDEKKEKRTSVRCNGIAKSTGVRCKLYTTNENGFCHHHQPSKD